MSQPIAGRTMGAWIARADELCARGKYFEAHEELELPWKAAAGADRTLLQGLIQLAAGLYRMRLHPENPTGGRYLLDRAIEKLDSQQFALNAASWAALRKRLLIIKDSGKAPESLHLPLKLL